MRVSNAPTVVTNVMVGAALATDSSPDWLGLAVFSGGMLCLYFAGMALNDLFDAKHDAAHKPNRPLVVGEATKTEAWIIVAGLLMLSLIFVGTVFPTWLALVICIFAYNLLHKRFAITVFLMGMCRGLTYLHTYIDYDTVGTRVTGALFKPAESPAIVAVFFASIIYIVLLTFVARREDDGSAGWRAKLSVLMPLTLPVHAISVANDRVVSALAVVCVALFMVWMLRSSWLLLRQSPDVRGAVTGWLSGICLFDAAILSLNGDDPLAFAALGCFALTVLAHKFVPGT